MHTNKDYTHIKINSNTNFTPFFIFFNFIQKIEGKFYQKGMKKEDFIRCRYFRMLPRTFSRLPFLLMQYQ